MGSIYLLTQYYTKLQHSYSLFSIQDAKAIIQVVPSIPFMLEDPDLHVVKRVIRCLSQLYKIAIKVRDNSHLLCCYLFVV